MYIIKIITFIRRLIAALWFNLLLHLAKAEARRRARHESRYMMVLVSRGKPIVLSADDVNRGIAARLFVDGFTVQRALQLAIYVAYPPAL